jgi:hypothetical protein
MDGIGTRVRNVPGWPFVLAWVAAFVVWNGSRGTWLALPGFVVWCVLTVVCLAVLVRWVLTARGWRRGVAIGLGLLIVAFFAQRLIDGTDDYEIERVIDRAAISTDPAACEETQTQAYMTQRTGVPPPFADDLCESYAGDPHRWEPSLLELDIDDDTAVATVRFRDGALGGSTVKEELVKEEGDWKLNRLLEFVNFDRVGFDFEYRRDLRAFGSSEAVVDCAMTALRSVPDEEIVRITLAGEVELYERIAVRCDRRAVELALLDTYESDEYWAGLPDATLACITRATRSATRAELMAMTRSPLEWDRVPLACDRAAYLGALGSALRDDGADEEAVECALGELRPLGDTGLIQRLYDDAAYAALLGDCDA